MTFVFCLGPIERNLGEISISEHVKLMFKGFERIFFWVGSVLLSGYYWHM